MSLALTRAESFNIIAIPKLKLDNTKLNFSSGSQMSQNMGNKGIEKYIETITQLKKLLEFSDRVIEKYKGEFAEIKSFLVQLNNKIMENMNNSPKVYIEAIKNYRKMIKEIHENFFKLTKILRCKKEGIIIKESTENLYLIKDEIFISKNFWSDKEEVITLFKVQKEFVKLLIDYIS